MAIAKERLAKNRCLLCSNEVEKSNLGSLCNPCKDKRFKYPFGAEKAPKHLAKAEAKVK